MTQAEALIVLKTGGNVFVTGEPGSGKTHTVNTYLAWLRERGIEPSVTAATGIAATHIGGQTLHSWSGMGIRESLSESDIDALASTEHVARRIQHANVLVIDEISMLSGSIFDSVNLLCQEVRRSRTPFGGLQVVLVGDFFQLPPIAGRGREVRFAYDSTTWRELNPLVCYLHEQHRQEDETFLGILSAIRSGDVEPLHAERLTSRKTTSQTIPQHVPRLFSHNADVDEVNAKELTKLPGRARTFRMTSRGKDTLVEALKRGCISPEELVLKKGAVVMFTKNSPQGKFVNGTLGTVETFDAVSGLPVIETHTGSVLTADPMEWQVAEEGKVRASITQVPLRLAWAITVHKSQGMSMDAAVVDLSKAFEYGQGYVALSRIRTLNGLHLLGLNRRALEVHPDVLEMDHEFRERSLRVAHTFAELPAKEIDDMHKRFVAAMGGVYV